MKDERHEIPPWAQPIYWRYLEEARALDGRGRRILKTDCFNEAIGWPAPSGIAPALAGDVALVELDAGTVEQARRRSPGLDIHRGDIRALPYRSRSFDAVLDLSTLDHLPAQDTGAVIAEYARVLRRDGRIVLVCWTKPMDEEDGVGIAEQNYFARGRIDGELHDAFRLTHRELLFVGQGGHAGAELVLWRGVRR